MKEGDLQLLQQSIRSIHRLDFRSFLNIPYPIKSKAQIVFLICKRLLSIAQHHQGEPGVRSLFKNHYHSLARVVQNRLKQRRRLFCLLMGEMVR
jgi:hypothetical protein